MQDGTEKRGKAWEVRNMRNEDQEILHYIHLSILPLSNTLATIFVYFITTLPSNLKNTMHVKVIVQIHACVRRSIYSPELAPFTLNHSPTH